MPKSLNNLIDDANRGIGEPIILSDRLLAIIRRMTETCQTEDDVMWPNHIVAHDPVALPAYPISYFRRDEAGKQQFCVRFGSGAIQVLATEP